MSALGLVVELVAGAIGGNGIASVAKNLSLGTLGNSLVGAIGGAAGTSFLGIIIPALESAGHADIGTLGRPGRRWRRARRGADSNRRGHPQCQLRRACGVSG